jgi:hypothetical protein
VEKSIPELIREGEEKNNLKVNSLPDKAVSLNDLKPKAIEAWNRRK